MSPPVDPTPDERFRYEYGAAPLHLIAVVASLALAAYAFLRIFENPSTAGVLLWLGAAVILHDLIALPIYSALARIAHTATEAAVAPRLALLALNHIRIPAALSLLFLLVSFPLVLGLDADGLEATTGLGAERYLGNWLLLTAVLFAGSGLLYALRMRGYSPPGLGPAGGGEEPPRTPGRSTNSVHRTENVDRLAWRLAARAVLALGALVAAIFAAAAIYGFVSAFPL